MHQLIQTIKQTFALWKYSLNRFNYEPIWLLNSAYTPAQTSNAPFSINELMNDGFLWGVPKKKPTVESRLKRRFGHEKFPQTCQVLKPRFNLVICDNCGDHHEAHTVCRTCYAEVMEETEKLKKEIKQQTNPVEPKEHEIRFKFANEEIPEEEEKDKDKFRIIEVSRERPKWFTKNLLAKSTGQGTGIRNVTLNPEDIPTIRKN